MRRYAFYLGIALSAFAIGLIVAFVSYLQTDINSSTVEEPDAKFTKAINKLINQIEAENTGFAELSNARNGDLITVQGYIDEKFLCRDVTDAQTDVCTTLLLDYSSKDTKKVLIRLQVCNELNKSSCIVWKPDNLCPNDLCSNQIRIYDNNSKFVELIERIGKNSFTSKNVKLKVTGKVSIVDGKPRLITPIEKLEIIEMR
jgi:hypothetical protein